MLFKAYSVNSVQKKYTKPVSTKFYYSNVNIVGISKEIYTIIKEY